MESAQIEELSTVTPETVEELARLVAALSSSASAPTIEELRDIVESPATTLFVARMKGQIIGTLTLVTFRIPTGVRARIEDVVTLGSARGRGVGSALTRAAMAKARELGARNVELTSRPSREAANALYRRLSFELRQTNVYRYEFR